MTKNIKMKNPILLIEDFKGGITLNKKLGRTDQFCFGRGLDFSSEAGYLTVGPAWTRTKNNVGGDFIATEFTHILHCIKDNNAYFLGENTIIYYLDGSGQIVLAADSDQTGVFKGAAEYESYLYYAQNTTTGRKDLSLAYNAGYTHNWQTLNSADYHPMKVSVNKKLYIGNGNDVASWDNTTFMASALDLGDNWQIRCLDDFGHLYLAIGANYYTSTYSSQKCKIFLWDRNSSSWNDEIIIPESEIKAMKFYAGYLWVWAGKSCNLYIISEGSRIATKILQFSREDPTVSFEVYPGAVLARRGTIFFGLSGGQAGLSGRRDYTNNSGIYSFPANPNQFSLNMPFNGGDYIGNYDEFKGLGLVRDSGDEKIYASFENTAGGIICCEREKTKASELHYSSTGEYFSFIFQSPKNKRIFTESFGVTFDPLPTGCSIGLLYRTETGENNNAFTDFSTANATEKKVYKKVRADCLQLILKVRGAISGTNYSYRPFIKSLFVTGSLISKV